MTKVAICYWGMTRSTRHVYMSHRRHIYDIFSKNNIEYDTYIHTWKTDANIIWNEISTIPIDYDEYKLLIPSEYKIEDQNIFLDSCMSHFSDYFNQELYNTYGGDTHHEWHPYLIKNYLCALESQKRVTQMCKKSNIKYDFVIYVRPDVDIHTDFPIEIFNIINKNQIAIPDEEHFGGYNDKFAIVPFENCDNYGSRIDEIIEFRKTGRRIAAEHYLKFIADKYFEKVHFVPFHFSIVRPK